MANINLNNVASKATADAHYVNTSNPHSVTKSQVGLGNADNTSDANKPVSTATQTALNLKQNISSLFNDIMALVLSGFSAGSNSAVVDTDTLAQSLAKFQGQINARPNETTTTIAAINHAATEKTNLVDADEITGQDSASSFSLIRTTWTNVKAFLKTYFDTLYSPAAGWVTDTSTWTYSSADSPTFVISVNADMTSTISVGMRIRLVQTTTKYFIVTEVGSFSAGATLITVYGGTDYTLANAAISSPYYSSAKAPFGFPTSKLKWYLETADTTQRTQANPTGNAWYNLNSDSITFPIGTWDVDYMLCVLITGTNGLRYNIKSTLSTANNSESDAQMTAYSEAVQADGEVAVYHTRRKTITVTVKTTYYLNSLVAQSGVTGLYNQNNSSPLIIRAFNAYL